MPIITPIDNWLSSQITNSSFHIYNSSLKNSKFWINKDGLIKHRSGHFFKIIGLRWHSPEGKIIEQPFIDQREIGTLGFVIRKQGETNQILIQAKIEPGNIGTTQIAPTCQATYSNIQRIHGGELPPFANFFNRDNIIYNALHSEQGNRFYMKCNSNILALNKDEIDIPKSHQWLDIDDLFDLAGVDYLINTDARSVLVSSPWQTLLRRHPFTRYKDGFSADLLLSYNSTTKLTALKKIKSEIILLRQKIEKPRRVALEKLKNWRVSDEGVKPIQNKLFQIRHIKINISSREVSTWDQPILDSYSEGKVILYCGRFNNVLHFLFKANAEPGLVNKVELTPSVVREPGDEKGEGVVFPPGKIRTDCRQSEEGGRFYQDVNRFQIIDVGDIFNPPLNHYWLTLKQIRCLLNEEGWFTNEARSALSLLLPWM